MIFYEGVAACTAKLSALMDEAKAALSAARALGQHQAATVAEEQATKFDDFVVASIGTTEEAAAIDKLDALAGKTSEMIRQTAIAEAVAAITARSNELNALIPALEKQTLANVSKEKRSRLLPVQHALTSMTDSVGAAKVLAKALDVNKPDEKAISDGVADLAAKLVAVQAAFGSVSG